MNDKPAMKSMLLAVFGHYDSRGGTAAVLIPDATEASIEKAKRFYNREMFGVEEPGEPIEKTVYGMPARKADQMVHELLHKDTTPGEEDLMWVAELHYPDDADIGGDLEEPGEGGRYRRVLKSGGEPDEHCDPLKGWPEGTIAMVTKVSPYESIGEYQEPEDEYAIYRQSLITPVQLELVVLPARLSVDKEEEELEPHMEIMRRIDEEMEKQQGGWREKYAWRDGQPEYKTAHDAADKIRESFSRRRDKAAIKQAQVIKDPTLARWDDDAFGFVIVGEVDR